MSTKPKGNEIQESQGTSTQAETRQVQVDNATHVEEIRRRAYAIYLERGEQPAVTIGSKRNANSNVECFAARTRDSQGPRHRRVRDAR
jgi:hypothetical protein